MARGPGLWPLAVGLWRLPCGDLAYGYLAVWPLWPLAVGLWRFGFWLFGCMGLGYGGPSFWRCGLLSYFGSGHVPLATLQLAICSSGYLIIGIWRLIFDKWKAEKLIADI